MKTFICHILIAAAMCLALGGCSQKKAASPMPSPAQDATCNSDSTAPTDTVPPVPVSTAAPDAPKAAQNSTFNGVSSKNSNGDDEILGFDDDVDDDNDMDAFMNDYHDDDGGR